MSNAGTRQEKELDKLTQKKYKMMTYDNTKNIFKNERIKQRFGSLKSCFSDFEYIIQSSYGDTGERTDGRTDIVVHRNSCAELLP